MKIIKVLIIILILTLSVGTFTACNLSDIFKATITDYEFSEDGYTEISKFYVGFYAGETDYSITWTCKNGEEVATIKWSRLSTDTVVQYSKFFDHTQESIRVLEISENEKYYIDEKTKSYSLQNSIEYEFLEEMINLCAIKLTDEEEKQLWKFLEKTEDINIEDADGLEFETTQYIYESVKENSTDKLKINFDKKSFLGLYPVIKKIEYQLGDNKLEIYIKKLPNSKTEATDFEVPTEAEGYTLLVD